jgi:hypothetical protein
MYFIYFENKRYRDSAVGTVNGYGLEDSGAGVRVPLNSRMFSSPCRLHLFCGLPSIFFIGAGGGGYPRRLQLITHIQLVPRSSNRGSIHPVPDKLPCHSAKLVKYSDKLLSFVRIIYLEI